MIYTAASTGILSVDTGGDQHVAAYLAKLDLSGFNPKAPPPQTQAFWEIVNVNRVPENSELADLLDRLDNPDAVTIAQIIDSTRDAHGLPSEFGEWIKDRRGHACKDKSQLNQLLNRPSSRRILSIP